MKRALVLGGGGNVGIAWEIGVLAGLADGGVDASEADLVIGTSAGSVVGTQLRSGRDPRELLRELQDEQPRALGDNGHVPDMSVMTETFTLWGSFKEMTPEACAQVGALALKAKTVPEERWISAFEENGWRGWPERPLLITAVDCESGEFKAFDRDSGVPIATAVAASCSVPAMFPPVTIAGRRYTDGGVRSVTSADLALRIEPDAVLIIAPMGASDRGVGRVVGNQIEREHEALEASGASVRRIMFDDAAREASGGNLMDPTKRRPASSAGYALGSRLAPEMLDWWNGR